MKAMRLVVGLALGLSTLSGAANQVPARARAASRVDRTEFLRTAASVSITEFPLPTADSDPGGITSGPDGNLWFTEWAGNRIGRMTPGGTITEFPLPTANSYPNGITSGPDGNLWFTEWAGNRIGRMTPRGTITEFPLPTAKSDPGGITSGPDGNLWFTEADGNRIGQIAPSTVMTQVPTATPQPPHPTPRPPTATPQPPRPTPRPRTATPRPIQKPHAVSFSFDRLQIVNARHRPQHSFRSGDLLYTQSTYTLHHARGKVSVRIVQSYRYWNSTARIWLDGPHPLTGEKRVSSGRHVVSLPYRVPSFARDYQVIRIRVALTIGRRTRALTADIQIRR